MEGFRRDACARWADGGVEAGTQGRGGAHTDFAPTTEEDTNRGAGGSGEREHTTFAGPAVINESHASQRHRISHAFATSMLAHPSLGMLMKF